MIGGYLLITVITGALSALIYVVARLIMTGPNPVLENAVGAFLNGMGMAAAVRVAMLALSSSFVIGDTDRLYILIGSGAVMWVSVKSLITKLQKG